MGRNQTSAHRDQAKQETRAREAVARTIEELALSKENESNKIFPTTNPRKQAETETEKQSSPPNPQTFLKRTSLSHWRRRPTDALELHLHFAIHVDEKKNKLKQHGHKQWPDEYCKALVELIPLVTAAEANRRLTEKMAGRGERVGVKAWMVWQVVAEVKGGVGRGGHGGGWAGRGSGRGGHGGRGGQRPWWLSSGDSKRR